MKRNGNMHTMLVAMKKQLIIFMSLPFFFSCDSGYEEFGYTIDPNPKQLVTYAVGLEGSLNNTVTFSSSTNGVASKYDYVVYNATTLAFVHRQMGVVGNGSLTISDLLPRGQYVVVFLLVEELDKKFSPNQASTDLYRSGSGEVFQKAVLLDVTEASAKLDVALEKRTGAIRLSKDALPAGTAKVELKLVNLDDKLEVQTGKNSAHSEVVSDFTPAEWAEKAEVLINAVPSGMQSQVEVRLYNKTGVLLQTRTSVPFVLQVNDMLPITL